MNFSYFQGGIKNTTKSTPIDLAHAFKLITSDRFKDAVEKLRAATDKSIQKVLKSSLDYFTFSGVFKKREDAGLESHSGLICIDFDKLEDLSAVKDKLLKDPLTALLFLSPSGNGLKLVVKMDRNDHLGSFHYLEGYYLHQYGLEVDKSCKDVSRACFVSYDPECFFNPDSQVLEMPSEDLKFDPASGEVFTETEKLPEDKERQLKVVEAYVRKIEDSKIDLTNDYSDWLIICFCFSVFGEKGRALFHRISSINEKYTALDADKKFNNALLTSRFTTPAKFITIAKSYGVKIQKIKTLAPARAEGVEIDESTEWKYILGTKGTTELTDEQKKAVHRFRVVEYESRYFEAEKFNQDAMTVHLKPFSNFIIRPLFLVLSKIDPKRIIEIENVYGVKKTIDIPTKAFTSIAEFNAFVESQGNFLFTVKSPPFTLLKVKVYEQTMNAEEVKTLGWQTTASAYFFANGAFFNNKFYPIDDYGILTLPKKQSENEEEETKGKHYFIPALSDIYRDSEESFENEKKFIYIRRPDVKFEDWATLFYKVHNGNGMMGMLFYMAALFSDLIYSKFKFFPHLFLFGLPGSGKSTLAWSLQSLFGMAQTPFQLSAGTPVGFFRTFANFKNGLAWFDEYANDIDPKRIQALKGAYDRTGHIKGLMDNSNKTTTTHINSACLISGQQLPIADVALFKRCILLQFDTTEHSEEAKANLSRLQELEQKGLSHITAAMMTFRKHIEDNFLIEFEKVNKEIMPELGDVSESRIVLNAMVAMAMYKLTADKLKFPFTYEQLRTFSIKNIKAQNQLISHSKETSVFWDLMTFLLTQNMIKEGDDFKLSHTNRIVHHIDGEKIEKEFPKGKTVLYLRMARIHPLYMEHHRKLFNKNGMDKNSITHYLTSQKSYLGMIKNVRFGDLVSSAYIFDHELLEKDGYDFEKHLTDPVEPVGEEAAMKFTSTPPHPPEIKISFADKNSKKSTDEPF